MKKLVLLLVVLVGMGGTAMSQTKIAHVKSQVLWDTLPSAKVALAQYAKFEKDAYEELNEMQVELQTAAEAYQAKAPDLIRSQREYEEKKLMEFQERIESTNQSLKDFLIQTSNDLNAPLQDRIKRAIDIVAVQMKFAYVIDATAAIYSGGGQDITEAVIKVLLELDVKESVADGAAN